jgi:hypothetical protein
LAGELNAKHLSWNSAGPNPSGEKLLQLFDTNGFEISAPQFAAEFHLLKLQGLQNKVLRTIGSFPRRTPVCDMHEAFQIPCVYDYITKSCRQQAEVIQNHENENTQKI